MTRNVLIAGAGVAGLALAYWLERAGCNVTIVEIAPGFRRGGQAIDIRGVALDVVDAMGLLPEVQALRTRSTGMSIVDANGDELQRTHERTFSAGRLDSEDIELFRDDLCATMMSKLGDRVTYLYGDSIRAYVDHGDRVTVDFSSGAQRDFDFVVGADGIYSRLRRQCFDDEAACLRSLGVVLTLFTTPNLIDLKDWQIAHRVEGLGYVIYPNLDHTELRIGVGFGIDGSAINRGDVEAQKRLVAERCAGLKGNFPRFIDAMMTTSEFYYNELAQIHLPQWSKGRVVLLGDAAHCASPFSGQGTSLALVGAFVLARELVHHDASDLSRAFAAYEHRMRPYVQLNQNMVDLTHQGPVPDDVMTRAKMGIDLADLLAEVA